MKTNNRKRESRTDATGGARKARFTFIDLFAGIGGFRIGLEALGGKCVYSVERNKFSRQTYEAWFGAPPDGGDINHIDRDALPQHTIMTAGFPCQPFSKAGESKRKSLGRKTGLDAEDDGQHIYTLAEILDESRPPAFVLENVSDLLTHEKGKTWDVIHTLLTKAGYSVSAKVFNAKDFNVPQSRKRVLIVGFDRRRFGDDPDFRFPEPQGREVSVLSDILATNPDPALTISEKAMRGHETHAVRHKEKGNGFNFRLVDVKKVGPTLTAHYSKGGKEILIPQHGIMPRRLSPRETARYMGYGDYLPIVVSNTQAYRQFGNAVVPAIVEAVGAEVLRVLERHALAAQVN